MAARRASLLLCALSLISCAVAGLQLQVPASNEEELCAAFLSYNRPHYLIPTVRMFYAYVGLVEPSLRFRVEVLDNGSNEAARKAILAGLGKGITSSPTFRFTSIKPTFLSRAMNKLFFEQCTAPYILSLEEDWQARARDWPAGFPVLALSMAILKASPRTLEVWLRDDATKANMVHKDWQHVAATFEDGSTPSLRFMMHEVTCPPEGGYGGYTNGASVKDRGRLLLLGGFNESEKIGEKEYSTHVCDHGYSSLFPCLDRSCYNGRRGSYSSLFEHIGRRRVRRVDDVRFAKKVTK